MPTSGAVLIDTDVFSALYITPPEVAIRQGHPLDRWKALLTGRRPVIAFSTRAETLSGAYLAKWGARRLADARAKLDAMPTIHEDVDVVEEYAKLVAAARAVGHPFGDRRQHVMDRWIAACAIAKHIPLLTGNHKHFRGAPGLDLLTDPG